MPSPELLLPFAALPLPNALTILPSHADKPTMASQMVDDATETTVTTTAGNIDRDRGERRERFRHDAAAAGRGRNRYDDGGGVGGPFHDDDDDDRGDGGHADAARDDETEGQAEKSGGRVVRPVRPKPRMPKKKKKERRKSIPRDVGGYRGSRHD